MENLLHIVFDQAGAEILRQSFQMDDIIAGEIVVLEDDLAFGPLASAPAREEWWRSLAEFPEGFPGKTDKEKMDKVLETLEEDENTEVWIWAAQNAADVCGYYSLVPHLGEYLGRVHILYLNNLPFINEKGAIFYPTALSQILPKEFLKARKLAREITPSEFELDSEEWMKFKEENLPVRILEGGKKITSQAEDFFDKDLLNYCTGNFQKASRVISQVMTKSKNRGNEFFLNGRLKTLVVVDKLEVQGTLNEGKEFSVKIKSAATENSETSTKADNTGEV